jgi:hypothetical protein
MAPQAQFTLGIARQKLDVVRMISGRSVTVLALDSAMRRPPHSSDVLAVALRAGVVALVLDRELLPLFDVAQAMKVIREAFAMDAEVLRNEKRAGNEYHYYESDCDPQWVQHVSLHDPLP